MSNKLKVKYPDGNGGTITRTLTKISCSKDKEKAKENTATEAKTHYAKTVFDKETGRYCTHKGAKKPKNKKK